MRQRSAAFGFRLGIFLVLASMATFSGPPLAGTDAPVQAGEPETAQASGENAAAGDSAKPESEVVLYYFHGTRRCRTCLSIESYSKEAIEEEFAGQLASGELQWRVVNFEEKRNRHFVEDFGLVSSSVVVVEAVGDDVSRYQVLQEAWTLVRKKPKFIEYVQGSVRDYLE